MDTTQTAIRTSIFSIIGNLFLAIVKFVAGYVGNSYALIADAIESTTDIFSSIFVFFGIKYSSKPADENHPYGHGKAEVLITIVVVSFLVVSATIIAVESIKNIIKPHSQPEPFTLIVLGCIILFKEFCYQYVVVRSKKTNSSSLKADAWHHRSDALTSLLAFIGISISLLMGDGWEAADDVVALLCSGVIYYNAYKIFRPALGEIMEEHLYFKEEESIRKIAEKESGVIATEKCRIRKSGMQYFVDLHITISGEMKVVEGHQVGHNVKDAIIAEMPCIADVLIHIEPDIMRNHMSNNQIKKNTL